jgi:hypothetical protein
MNRTVTFMVALAYLSLILALGLLFFLKRQVLFFLPNSFGPVPVGVPWFGALGSVLISLTGVFEHEHDWDEGYWPWHIARPLIGVGLGVVSVLIMQAGVLAVGSAPQSDGPKNLLYYLVAFLVGYREQTFRELIKRLVDVILSPGTSPGTLPNLHQANPPQAPHATPTQVVIAGSGLTGTQTVKFGSLVAQFTVNSDGQITATTPNGGAAGAVSLTVTTKRGSSTLPFTFT